MHIRSDQIIQLVEDAVNDLDKQMPLLVLQSGGHEQRQDLVEQRTRAELPSLVRDLTQRSLAHRRGAVLDL